MFFLRFSSRSATISSRRNHATKKIYQAYLSRWIRPHWQKYGLAEVRTIQVESWLRGLPLAKSSCAKIRKLMSVLFNHACRYDFLFLSSAHLNARSQEKISSLRDQLFTICR